MEEEAAAAPLDPGVLGEEAPASVPRARDRLLQRIHEARDFEGMMRVVERDAGAMAAHHLMAVVNCIVDQLQANGALDEQLRDAMHADGRFRLLLTQLVRRHRQLSAKDVVTVVQMLQYARVPDTSRVHLFFLQRLHDGLDEVSFGTLLFAGQMLLRYPATGNTLVNGLRAAIPGAFEGRLAGELDTDSIQDMSRALSVVANYRDHIRQPACQPLYDALNRWVHHHETDPALPTVLPPHAAAELLIRMERAAYLSHPVVDMVLQLLGNSHARSVRPETMRKLFQSVRNLRRKYPAEFPPAHRLHALETEMTASLPDATTGR
ncbi:uncharacterized protein LOC129600216 [Paramacrobiotus metropolitanus]|uniref:uncharacterized protein LOC129600216 n=1 Tax=Paramacrobiotus metropolitanus TaxID=2943436 RepID=UPI002445CAAD|nr:uncharacterized protein LOC129600216 [Paramacrobiotus metropolitanus]XP_055354639.1 uncharacterized protein LOC129600216 [Paramacrobiotus metropolitanus]